MAHTLTCDICGNENSPVYDQYGLASYRHTPCSLAFEEYHGALAAVGDAEEALDRAAGRQLAAVPAAAARLEQAQTWLSAARAHLAKVTK